MTDSPTRRDVLKGVLAASLATAAGTHADGKAPSAAGTPNRIAAENMKPGSRDWQLTRAQLDRLGGVRSPTIEGYCSKQSVSAGETIEIKVSADPAEKFQIEIFRMGYYGGAGARHMQTIGPLDGKPQPLPEVGPQRLRECRWETSAELTIPADWLSGVYLGRLTTLNDDNGTGYSQSYVIFIVRDQRPADVVFQCSDNTWQAYNQWPDAYSLYTDPRAAHAADVSVSFDRPYGKFPFLIEAPQSIGSGEFLLWEFPLCYWLEQHGYDVTYCSNSDLLTPDTATRGKAFLSVGHDEYWDLRQFESLQHAVKEGVNLVFLSANVAYMMSPFTPSNDGQPLRIITRAGPYGGLSEAEKQAYPDILGPFEIAGPDEGQLIGARTVVPFNGSGDWICTLPEHWIFADTGMAKGDRIPGLVGWEFHGDPADIPGLEIVGEGKILSWGTTPGRWVATIYPGPKGNFVFNASTIWWAQGLASPPGHMLPWSHWSRPHGPDERVQQITHNVLKRATGSG
ncbi:MAG: N,N-dimethylformamidase beta subunit family domain-containing protein [Planctomycetaceae bacterium]